jgi:hypothetical protein
MPFEAERLADESGVLYSKQEVAPGRGQPRAQNGRPESHGVVKGDRDQQRDPSNQYVAENG